jgi:hypothetical protein
MPIVMVTGPPGAGLPVAPSGWCPRSSKSVSRPEPDSCVAPAVLRQPAGSLRRGDRSRDETPPLQLPQAFTHLALINALLHLIEGERAEEEEHFGVAGPPPH